MGDLIDLQKARQAVLARIGGFELGVEEVPLDQALGRRLARPMAAESPWPSTDRSAMDGFGVRAADPGAGGEVELRVIGESLAGHPFAGEVADGQAIRIMTGAVVPPSVDAVVPVENTSGYAGSRVTVKGPVRRGDHIRPQGSEVAAGEQLLSAGTLVRSAEIGALATLGAARVPVCRRPLVAILSTGDEVVPIERAPELHQVRDSNSCALAAQVRECGGVPLRLGVGADDRDTLARLLRRGLDEADVLLTIGGVSKGTHDLVHGCLRELGVVEHFHGVALKPGKPTYFGERATGDRPRWAFGLPGNPASCYTVFDLLVRPMVVALGGGAGGAAEPQLLRRTGAAFKKNWRLQAIPAQLDLTPASAAAALEPVRPSGDPFGLLAADGYALIPGDADPETVSEVEFWPYSGRGSR